MPLFPLAPPFMAPSIQKMLGPAVLGASEAADATVTGNFGVIGLNVYRDLTLSGNANPTPSSPTNSIAIRNQPTIIVCRNLNLAGFTLNAQEAVELGIFYISVQSTNWLWNGALTPLLGPSISADIAPATGVPFEPWETLFAAGGAGGAGGGANNGSAGSNAASGLPIQMLLPFLLMSGCVGGGGGGTGGDDTVGGGGAAGAGGVRGGAGALGGSVEAGQGGGSGIGGGGGGGGTNTGTPISGLGRGGPGGGILVVIADQIIGTAGTIAANGSVGEQAGASAVNAGGGGGGGGGAVVVFARTVLSTPTLTATGGSGGAARGTAGTGASGGNGLTKLIVG